MYCTKCGKEAQSGDLYCGACGSKLGSAPVKQSPQKKKSNWVLILICVVAVVLATGKLFGGDRTSSGSNAPVRQQEQTVQQEAQLPPEPNDGDALEESDYADGTPRRRISNYGDVYITDYRPDGTQLRETILYYSSGTYGGKRVTNCDAHGNPIDETETMPDGTLWLYLYYENSYDQQGRPLKISQYNRMGFPLYVQNYTYNADGSYRVDWMEYRGPVYEYDYEYTPDGTTSYFAEGHTTFTAEGDVIDQMIYGDQ